MIQYNVELTKKAEKDIYDIIKYIEIELQEPNIAKNIYQKINNNIMNLNINPMKYPLVDDFIIKRVGLRKISIDNYIILYKVFESEKTVQIVKIVSDKRNWMKML